MTKSKQTAMGAMKALEIGESVTFPVSKLCSIRTNASTINAVRQSKSLVTKMDSEAGTVTVTRVM